MDIFGIHIPNETQLQYVQGKNKDLKEVVLRADAQGEEKEGRVLLKFA